MNPEEELRESLESWRETATGLKAEVIEEALDAEDIECWFSDLLGHGCVSGMIGSLIYYSDTCKFYDENEEEIEDLLTEFMDNCGYKSRPEAIMNLNGSAESIQQEKNLLSWFAFEETARHIAEMLEIEV